MTELLLMQDGIPLSRVAARGYLYHLYMTQGESGGDTTSNDG